MKRIYVNQYIVDRNEKLDLSAKGAPVVLEPPIVVTAKVVYRPTNTLPCGAKVWIETTEEVEVVMGGTDEVL